VLVVDNDGIVRHGLRALLAREGFDVAVATSAKAALRRLRSFAAEVVIMEADMPGMSGIEATRRLAEQTPSTAVLLFMIAADESLVLDAVRAGSAGLLLKDAPFEDITAGVRAVAAGKAVLDTRVAGVLVSAVRNAAAAADRRANPDGVQLSDREGELLELLAQGLNNATIGRRLFVSTSTVRNHVSRLLRKLAVDNRVQAAAYAARHGMLTNDDRAAA
jgi:DNA-binding NarL/FixJ family response regulator